MTLKLATGILILPQRNPLVLAKEVATLDHLSGGRVMLGTGVGWLAEEFAALGVPFEERGARHDEYVAVLRALWTGEAASYHGEFVDFSDCIVKPRPVNWSVPIHIGGHSPVAARRAGRLGDGFFPASGSHEELASLFALARESAKANVSRPVGARIHLRGNGAVGTRALDEVAALSAIGVSRVVLPAFSSLTTRSGRFAATATRSSHPVANVGSSR
jgi:probable F420-dependent oxidoreductase